MTESDVRADGDEAYVGEIRIFSFNFAPRYWAQCNGQEMSIQNNLAIFALLGTQFGGNGSTTFCLPDLRARVPVHTYSGNAGQHGGESTHTLTQAEMPMHNHIMYGSGAIGDNLPGPDKRIANNEPTFLYGPVAGTVPMNNGIIGYTGGSGPHENRQPYLGLMVCICLAGTYPSRPVLEDLAEVTS
jgi:microcystin-dependent protein